MGANILNTRLIDLVEAVFVGFNPSRLIKTAQTTEPRPFIQIKDVIGDRLPPIEDLGQVDFPVSPQTSRLELRAGDTLVSIKGTLMKCALITSIYEGAIPSSNFVVVRPSSEIRPELVWAFFRSPKIQSHMNGLATGSVHRSLSLKDFQPLSIKVPPKHIQDKIAKLILTAERYYDVATQNALLKREESLDVVARFCATDDKE